MYSISYRKYLTKNIDLIYEVEIYYESLAYTCKYRSTLLQTL